MKLFFFGLLFFLADLSAAELLIVDQGRFIHFLASGDEYENIEVSSDAFKLNFGMTLEISDAARHYKFSANDTTRARPKVTLLTEGRIIGRRLPKQELAFFYGLTTPGIYTIVARVCLNEKECLPEATEQILFSQEHFPISSRGIED